MRIDFRTFSLPKAGREFDDYEDACFPSDSSTPGVFEQKLTNASEFRTVVCDGATDSCFSGYWAHSLAEAYGTGKFGENVQALNIVEIQADWKDYLSKQDLPWYAEEKAEQGAFAAIVGLTIINDGKRFRSMAVGDCCLFHIRNNALLESFPVQHSNDFDNFPYLIGSLAERNQGVFEHKLIKEDGSWQSGDVFFLMSDAVAMWFMRQIEDGEGGEWIERLNRLSGAENFAGIIRAQRQQMTADNMPAMKDDDCTFARVEITDTVAEPAGEPERASRAGRQANANQAPTQPSAPAPYSAPAKSSPQQQAMSGASGTNYPTQENQQSLQYQSPRTFTDPNEVRQRIESIKETSSSTSLRKQPAPQTAPTPPAASKAATAAPKGAAAKARESAATEKPRVKNGKEPAPAVQAPGSNADADDDEGELSYAQQIAQMNKRKSVASAANVRYKKDSKKPLVIAGVASVAALTLGVMMSAKMNPLAQPKQQPAQQAPAPEQAPPAAEPAHPTAAADPNAANSHHSKRHHHGGTSAPATKSHHAYSTH